MSLVLNVWHWEWWLQTCVPYIWWCRRARLLSMTTSPAAPICPVATISGERPAALVSPATDLIGEGVSHSCNRGEVDSFWYSLLLFVVRRKWDTLHCRVTLTGLSGIIHGWSAASLEKCYLCIKYQQKLLNTESLPSCHVNSKWVISCIIKSLVMIKDSQTSSNKLYFTSTSYKTSWIMSILKGCTTATIQRYFGGYLKSVVKLVRDLAEESLLQQNDWAAAWLCPRPDEKAAAPADWEEPFRLDRFGDYLQLVVSKDV